MKHVHHAYMLKPQTLVNLHRWTVNSEQNSKELSFFFIGIRSIGGANGFQGVHRIWIVFTKTNSIICHDVKSIFTQNHIINFWLRLQIKIKLNKFQTFKINQLNCAVLNRYFNAMTNSPLPYYRSNMLVKNRITWFGTWETASDWQIYF